jgi:arginase
MAEPNIVVLDAPSNLGLSPPEEGTVPGCYKLPWAVRDRNLLELIDAADAGSLVPPRYRANWEPGDGDRNAESIANYSVALADRLTETIQSERQIVVLGGDCSILIGNMLALKRRGRYGLVYLDAHSDFRHPGHTKAIGAAGGESLAIVTGRGDVRLVGLEDPGPYVRDEDVSVVGVRENDEYIDKLTEIEIDTTTSQQMNALSSSQLADQVLRTVARNTTGFWIHLDVDVVDAKEMHAVDCPEDDGPSFNDIAELLARLLSSPACIGLEVTIYDPDLDPKGECADRIVECLRKAFRNNADN